GLLWGRVSLTLAGDSGMRFAHRPAAGRRARLAVSCSFRQTRLEREAVEEKTSVASPGMDPALDPAVSARRWRWAWLWVALIAAAAYANTLKLGFTWDDQWLILDNERLTDPAQRPGYVRYMLFERPLWRPVKRTLLMLDYAWHGPKELPGHPLSG